MKCPDRPCPHCGASQWWRNVMPYGLHYSCLSCGYVYEPIHFDPEAQVALRADCRRRRGEPVMASLPPLGREHEIRYHLSGVERSLAELRSVAGVDCAHRAAGSQG